MYSSHTVNVTISTRIDAINMSLSPASNVLTTEPKIIVENPTTLKTLINQSTVTDIPMSSIDSLNMVNSDTYASVLSTSITPEAQNTLTSDLTDTNSFTTRTTPMVANIKSTSESSTVHKSSVSFVSEADNLVTTRMTATMKDLTILTDPSSTSNIEKTDLTVEFRTSDNTLIPVISTTEHFNTPIAASSLDDTFTSYQTSSISTTQTSETLSWFPIDKITTIPSMIIGETVELSSSLSTPQKVSTFMSSPNIDSQTQILIEKTTDMISSTIISTRVPHTTFGKQTNEAMFQPTTTVVESLLSSSLPNSIADITTIIPTLDTSSITEYRKTSDDLTREDFSIISLATTQRLSLSTMKPSITNLFASYSTTSSAIAYQTETNSESSRYNDTSISTEIVSNSNMSRPELVTSTEKPIDTSSSTTSNSMETETKDNTPRSIVTTTYSQDNNYYSTEFSTKNIFTPIITTSRSIDSTDITRTDKQTSKMLASLIESTSSSPILPNASPTSIRLLSSSVTSIPATEASITSESKEQTTAMQIMTIESSSFSSTTKSLNNTAMFTISSTNTDDMSRPVTIIEPTQPIFQTTQHSSSEPNETPAAPYTMSSSPLITSHDQSTLISQITSEHLLETSISSTETSSSISIYIPPELNATTVDTITQETLPRQQISSIATLLQIDTTKISITGTLTSTSLITTTTTAYTPDSCQNATQVALPNGTCLSYVDGQEYAVNVMNSLNASAVSLASALSLYISSTSNRNGSNNMSNNTVTPTKINEVLDNIDNISVVIISDSSILVVQDVNRSAEQVIVGASYQRDAGGSSITNTTKDSSLNGNFSVAAFISTEALNNVKSLKMFIIDRPIGYESVGNATNKSLVSSVIVASVTRLNSSSAPMNISLYFTILPEYRPSLSVNYMCSFYDTNGSTWNETGCTTPIRNTQFDRYECSCNHLTTFGLTWSTVSISETTTSNTLFVESSTTKTLGTSEDFVSVALSQASLSSTSTVVPTSVMDLTLMLEKNTASEPEITGTSSTIPSYTNDVHSNLTTKNLITESVTTSDTMADLQTNTAFSTIISSTSVSAQVSSTSNNIISDHMTTITSPSYSSIVNDAGTTITTQNNIVLEPTTLFFTTNPVTSSSVVVAETSARIITDPVIRETSTSVVATIEEISTRSIDIISQKTNSILSTITSSTVSTITRSPTAATILTEKASSSVNIITSTKYIGLAATTSSADLMIEPNTTVLLTLSSITDASSNQRESPTSAGIMTQRTQTQAQTQTATPVMFTGISEEISKQNLAITKEQDSTIYTSSDFMHITDTEASTISSNVIENKTTTDLLPTALTSPTQNTNEQISTISLSSVSIARNISLLPMSSEIINTPFVVSFTPPTTITSNNRTETTTILGTTTVKSATLNLLTYGSTTENKTEAAKFSTEDTVHSTSSMPSTFISTLGTTIESTISSDVNTQEKLTVSSISTSPTTHMIEIEQTSSPVTMEIEFITTTSSPNTFTMINSTSQPFESSNNAIEEETTSIVSPLSSEIYITMKPDSTYSAQPNTSLIPLDTMTSIQTTPTNQTSTINQTDLSTHEIKANNFTSSSSNSPTSTLEVISTSSHFTSTNDFVSISSSTSTSTSLITTTTTAYTPDSCQNATQVALPNGTCLSYVDGQEYAVNVMNSLNASAVSLASALSLYISSTSNRNGSNNMSNNTVTPTKINEVLDNIDNISVVIISDSSILVVQDVNRSAEQVIVGASYQRDAGGSSITNTTKDSSLNGNFSVAAFISTEALNNVKSLKMFIIDRPIGYESVGNATNKSLVSSVIVASVTRLNSSSAPMNISLYFTILPEYRPSLSVNYMCSFYDTNGSTWNETGCTTPIRNTQFDRYECSCNHLTTFGLTWSTVSISETTTSNTLFVESSTKTNSDTSASVTATAITTNLEVSSRELTSSSTNNNATATSMSSINERETSTLATSYFTGSLISLIETSSEGSTIGQTTSSVTREASTLTTTEEFLPSPVSVTVQSVTPSFLSESSTIINTIKDMTSISTRLTSDQITLSSTNILSSTESRLDVISISSVRSTSANTILSTGTTFPIASSTRSTNNAAATQSEEITTMVSTTPSTTTSITGSLSSGSVTSTDTATLLTLSSNTATNVISTVPGTTTQEITTSSFTLVSTAISSTESMGTIHSDLTEQMTKQTESSTNTSSLAPWATNMLSSTQSVGTLLNTLTEQITEQTESSSNTSPRAPSATSILTDTSTLVNVSTIGSSTFSSTTFSANTTSTVTFTSSMSSSITNTFSSTTSTSTTSTSPSTTLTSTTFTSTSTTPSSTTSTSTSTTSSSTTSTSPSTTLTSTTFTSTSTTPSSTTSTSTSTTSSSTTIYNPDTCLNTSKVALPNGTCVSYYTGQEYSVAILNSGNASALDLAKSLSLYFSAITNSNLSNTTNSNSIVSAGTIDATLTKIRNITIITKSNSSFLVAQPLNQNSNESLVGALYERGSGGSQVTETNTISSLNSSFNAAAIISKASLRNANSLQILIIDKPTMYETVDNITNKSLASSVIVCTVSDLVSSSDKMNISLYFTISPEYQPNVDATYLCSFYDTANSRWNETGCTNARFNPTFKRYECSCDHLTSFALIWLPQSQVGSYGHTLRAADIASLVFQSVSIGCFLIVMIHSSVVRLLNPTLKFQANNMLPLISFASTTILFIFYIALGMTVYTQTTSETETKCFLSSSVLMFFVYFFLIFMFCVKTSIGYFNYRRFVSLFPEPKLQQLCKLLIISFLISISWVSFAAGFNSNASFSVTQLYPYRLCWFTRDVIYYFMTIPVCIFLLLNCFTIIFVSKHIIRHARNATSRHHSYERMKRCVLIILSSCVTQGIGWLFGPFISFVSPTGGEVLEWFFIIFNGLEGVWCIILYIIIRSQRMKEQKRITAVVELTKTASTTTRKYDTSSIKDDRVRPVARRERTDSIKYNLHNESGRVFDDLNENITIDWPANENTHSSL